jgi:uncharacterized RDD family membrane protein YckC
LQTIDITTSQNVTIEYDLASWTDRTLAFVVDLLINFFSFLICSSILGKLLEDSSFRVVPYIVFLFHASFYSLIWETLLHGRTVGKMATGIRVVKLDGSLPTINDYALRWSMRLLDIVLSFGTVATLLVNSSSKRQRLGDVIAGTTVVKLNPVRKFTLKSILQINTVSNYEPVYKEITQFSERDMLFIKNALDRYMRYSNTAHQEVLEELTKHICQKLDIRDIPRDKVKFLKTLINDYIVLTR